MKIFISGGAKNGKSTFAEDMAIKLADGDPLFYIATMVPTDEEDRERIRRHQESRQGKGFETIEKPRDLSEITLDDPEVMKEGTFLLDSVTALLSNVMFPLQEDDGEPVFDLEAGEKVWQDLYAFSQKPKNLVLVSDYIYSEAKVFDEWTENYRKALAFIDRKLAENCEVVVEIAAGQALWHKGQDLIK